MIRKITGKTVSVIRRSKTACVVVGSAVLVNYAHAAVPAEIDAIATDSGTLFATVKTFVVGVVTFGVLIGLVKMLKKR